MKSRGSGFSRKSEKCDRKKAMTGEGTGTCFCGSEEMDLTRVEGEYKVGMENKVTWSKIFKRYSRLDRKC